MIGKPVFRDGDNEHFERVGNVMSASGAVGRRDSLIANAGESLASITQRAYGVNTPEFRERIVSANGRLEGKINVPR